MTQKHCFIIPNYNGATFIADALENTLSVKAGHIIVVDDFSSDHSVSIIEKYAVTLIKRKENGGFAAAVNEGLREAQKIGFSYATVMNSDVYLNPDFSSTILQVVGNLSSSIEHAVAGFCEDGTDRYFENDQISGFLFTLKLEVLQRTGYLNEEFYMYGEETEFFRRILAKGYKIIQTGVLVRHYGEKSSNGSIYTSWFSIRNAIFLELLHKNYVAAFKTVAVLFLMINFLYRPMGARNDPSYNRVMRAGIIRGNYFLLKSIMWNFSRFLRNKQER